MKVLFIDTTHEILKQNLEKQGFECHYFSDYKYDDFLKIIPEYHGLIIRSKITLDKKILKAANQLKFIGRVGAGMENIDVEYAQSKGIACLNSPEGNRDAVAEHAIGMILALRNHLIKANSEVRKGIWLRAENRGFELKGKTMAIIGYGNMGRAFAQRLSGFQMNVIAYDKYKNSYSDEWVKEVKLEKVFETADIVSFHVPLTQETKYMFNEEWINKMEKPFYMINTARGPVVNTNELLKGIQKEKVLGAALDVLEFEGASFEEIKESNVSPVYKQLIQSEKVMLSPHIAGWTVESNIKLSSVIADKIQKLKL